MDNLQRLGDTISVTLLKDEEGFTGRECPGPDCLGYFKVQFGTGLKGEGLPCNCPYCGFVESHSKFATPAQIEFLKSVAMNRITEALIKDLKAMEFNHPPRGAFGIGLSLKVEGRSHPIKYYHEKQLETVVICEQCTLRYAIYGLFGFCPDCGTHNSLQILKKNFELAGKQIILAGTVEAEMAEYLINDALENAVSSFDGFGREICRVRAAASSNPAKAEGLSFQNLVNAKRQIDQFFGFNFSVAVKPEEWNFACRCFQKRHLLAHRMGVIDEAYVKTANDPQAVIGRKVSIEPNEVATLITILQRLGEFVAERLERIAVTGQTTPK